MIFRGNSNGVREVGDSQAASTPQDEQGPAMLYGSSALEPKWCVRFVPHDVCGLKAALLSNSPSPQASLEGSTGGTLDAVALQPCRCAPSLLSADAACLLH